MHDLSSTFAQSQIEVDKECYKIQDSHKGAYTQGEIRCFRNSEMLRKPDGSKFRHVSARRLRRETCKMKMEALFRVSAALPLT